MNWLRTVGWWASDYAYAVDRQVRSTLSRRKPLLDGDRAPVVILPGIYESWKFMLPLAAEIHSRGHPVHPVEALGRLAYVRTGAKNIGASRFVATVDADGKRFFEGAAGCWIGRGRSRTAVGQAAKSPFVEITQAKKIDIKLDRKHLYEIDGGERDKVKKLKVRAKSKAIRVMVPVEES